MDNARVLQVVRNVLSNLKKMVLLAWRMDKKTTLAYFAFSALTSVFPIATMFTLKYLIDSIMMTDIPVTGNIPIVLAAVLATRYVIVLLDKYITTGLFNAFYDTIFRYKLQSELFYRFSEKSADLDIPYLEDADSQNLITKAREGLFSRPPEFLRQSSLMFGALFSWLTAFFALVPFGILIPIVLTLSITPRLILRLRQGEILWTMYSTVIPQTKIFYSLNGLFNSIPSLLEMKIFRSKTMLLEKLKSIQDYLYRQASGTILKYLKRLPLPTILETSVLVAFAFLKLPTLLAGAITLGAFTLFINLIDRFNVSAMTMVSTLGYMYEYNLHVNDYFNVIELPKLIKERDNPVIFKDLAPPKIEFRNVSFAYKGGPKVLDGVSFTIGAGESIALVGANGAGKTSIVKLICRFYDVTDGEILINGVNIKDLKLSEWYRFLGTLFQDFVKYHLTVRENILLGDPHKSDDELMRKAASRSGADEFIEKLPSQYDQVLGREFENGTELSIGQWQKLAIARAFYQEAPFLILDEPTSAIDAISEYEIFQNIEKVYKGKTLLLISHRFSTVRNADRIFVIENGRITESGSHEELLTSNGQYAEMFRLQALGYQ
ncbi:MAG: ABC transporter ATP-binding protein [Candidatus Omnitrophica bacterium]|nr:ABC transporter ATP-binding protein [Candidatus Omnitrophota bacterium]